MNEYILLLLLLIIIIILIILIMIIICMVMILIITILIKRSYFHNIGINNEDTMKQHIMSKSY